MNLTIYEALNRSDEFVETWEGTIKMIGWISVALIIIIGFTILICKLEEARDDQ